MKSCSVVVPLYKGNQYIPRLISMIEKWKEADRDLQLELILVNDYPSEPVVLPPGAARSGMSVRVLVNERNMGIHYSRMTGALHATGDYTVFLDQDDLLSEHYFASQLAHMKDGEAVVCNGLWRNGEKIYSQTNPMRPCHSFEDYLENGYPLISLGQLLIRRDRIPPEWLNPDNVMVHNGWDDVLLWALMMVRRVKVNNNEEVLYIHEEDGSNASFNWKNMSLSGRNFKEIFLRLNLMNEAQEKKFRHLVDDKISKYETYDRLDRLIHQVTAAQLEQFFVSRQMRNIAIYGIGVYGKKLLALLQETGIRVKYCIDKRHDIKHCALPVFPLGRELPEVDAIIVTPVSSYGEIRQELADVCAYKTMSLLDVLQETIGSPI